MAAVRDLLTVLCKLYHSTARGSRSGKSAYTAASMSAVELAALDRNWHTSVHSVCSVAKLRSGDVCRAVTSAALRVQNAA
jgi:hypothetical protein